jgi:antitoxin component of MazEF toxin-antitoxin module
VIDIQLTVSTSGDSVCINVPGALAKQFGLVKSTKVFAKFGDGILVVFPIRYYRRQDLLASTTPETIPNDAWDMPA